jgi:branched-chain amino acid transport system ATP-binding protein
MREQNGPPKLQVQDTHIGFGGLRALQWVSVDVHEGEITAIIGPIGAGKTTLLNAISGVYHPSRAAGADRQRAWPGAAL